jgi:ferric enterobactin receptor
MKTPKFFLLLFLCLGALSLKGQNLLVEVHCQDEPLSKVLKHLHQQYQIDFAYDPDRLAQVRVSRHLTAQAVGPALKALFQDTGFTFEQLSSREFLVVAAPVVKKQLFELRGRVVDGQTNQPLAFASIQAKSLNKGTFTDEQGAFRLEELPAGTHAFQIELDGYNQQVVTLNPAGNPRIEIRMLVGKHDLSEVVIWQGSEQSIRVADAPGQLKINPQKISTLSGLGEPDVIRAIQLLPGVLGTNVASGGLHIRGGTPDQNLVLFDGITAYRIDHFLGLFSAFNTRAIQSVDLYRGGFGAKYGGRVSSVLDITGKAGSYDKPHASAGANLLNAHGHLELPLLGKKGSLLVAGRRSYSDIINNPFYQGILRYMTSPPEVNRYQNLFRRSSISIPEAYSLSPKIEFDLASIHPNPTPEASEVEFYDLNSQLRYQPASQDILRYESVPEFDFYDLNGKLNFQLSDRDFLSATLYQGGDALSYTYDQEPLNGRQIETIDQLSLKNRGLSANWSRQWNANKTSQFTLAYSKYGSLYQYGFRGRDDSSHYETSIHQENSIRDLSLRSDHSWQLNSQNRMEFGTEFTQRSIAFSFDSDTVLLQNHDAGATIASYLQHHFEPTDGLKMSLGLRSTFHQPTQKVYFSPRLSLDYALSERLKFKSAWGVYHQFVNRIRINNGLGLGEEFWAMADGQDIPVQMASHLILGAGYETNDFSIDLEAYHKYTEGLITYSYGFAPVQVVEGSGEELSSGGQAVVKGFDLLVQKKWNDIYTVWLSYSLSRVKQRFLDINLGEGFPALQDQRHELKLVSQLNVERWELAGTMIFASGRPYTEAENTQEIITQDGNANLGLDVGELNGARLPAYHRLDFTFAYKLFFSKQLKGQLGISVYNAYNRRNVRSRRYFLKEPVNDFQQAYIQSSDVLDLGVSPNIFFSLEF